MIALPPNLSDPSDGPWTKGNEWQRSNLQRRGFKQLHHIGFLFLSVLYRKVESGEGRGYVSKGVQKNASVALTAARRAGNPKSD